MNCTIPFHTCTTAKYDSNEDNLALEQGWRNPQRDEYYNKRHQRADNVDDKARNFLFSMMRQIGDELQSATGLLKLHWRSPRVLDLCMAPGGYTASALKYTPHARVCGITLPESDGGHRLLVRRRGFGDKRVDVLEVDITMLWSEFCDEDIPDDQPDKQNFLVGQRPFLEKSFDLIFCDGQVLRTPARSTYREKEEARRLTCSQLILAVQRIKPGGTIIVLLHRIDAWDSVKLLFQFNKFARIQVFKPEKKHNQRGSFYLIATKVAPKHPTAISALEGWKTDWRDATFAWNKDATNVTEVQSNNTDEVSHVLAEFGSKLIELGEPIWTIQRDALRRAPYTSDSKEKTKDTQAPARSTLLNLDA
jgi:23S rRNA U2552 (ribose-2'-O)-methylase RlmE/FtsJ